MGTVDARKDGVRRRLTIGLILLLSIPITNLLANIVATWLEPIVKTRKRVVVFLFILFSLIGGFFLDHFKVSEDIKNLFTEYTTNSSNEEARIQLEATPSNEYRNTDTTYHKPPDTQIILIPKPISTAISSKKALAFQQPLGVKIIGWILILIFPTLLFFSIKYFTLAEKNYAIAKGYDYGFWEWFWSDKYGNVANNKKYNEIAGDYNGSGWLCFIFFWGLIIILIATYKNFTPSLYAIEVIREAYVKTINFFAFLWIELTRLINELLTPLFY